jgi:archaellum component FlaC
VADPGEPERGEVQDLEERVRALESRMNLLESETRHGTDIAVIAAREALTAREAHQKNIELLNALRVTQAEHSAILAEHTEILGAHSSRLDRIEGRLGTIDGKLGGLTVGMHTIESLLRRLVDEEGS